MTQQRAELCVVRDANLKGQWGAAMAVDTRCVDANVDSRGVASLFEGFTVDVDK